MICPKCHTVFDLPANFCPQCGAGLQRSGGRILTLAALFVLVLIAGAYAYVKYQLYQSAPDPRRSSQELTGIDTTRSPPRERVQAGGSSAPVPSIVTADLILADIGRRQILNAPVAVLSPGWIAFPTRASIGAHSWRVVMPSGRTLAVEGGVRHDDAPVGLWRLPVAVSRGQPELMPWSPETALTWRPLEGSFDGGTVPVRTVENLTDFVRFDFETADDSPGVFLQNGHVVGWSFGTVMPGGYLWTGNPGKDLAVEFYPDDFYRLTFAGGREEAILLALANDDLPDLQRLEALAAAYRLEPRLSAPQTPDYLAPDAIQPVLRDLVARLASQGRSDDLLALMEPQIVLAMGDPSLAAALIKVSRDQGAYTYANEMIDALENARPGDVDQGRRLADLQAELYGQWLNDLIAGGSRFEAQAVHREALERFPDDAAIHLAGVELALMEQDWVQAERLLAARRYPPELRDRASRLQQEISALKAEEGKIVIRFRPGSRIIPVVARLGRDLLDQRFVIDTGASIVTVPSSTARRLDIDISDNLPRRLFYSATGVQHAVEITLPLVELDGWVVENVNALVVDLPGQPDVGLLGMNYLSNFRMDVNTEEGLLLLEPR